MERHLQHTLIFVKVLKTNIKLTNRKEENLRITFKNGSTKIKINYLALSMVILFPATINKKHLLPT